MIPRPPNSTLFPSATLFRTDAKTPYAPLAPPLPPAIPRRPSAVRREPPHPQGRAALPLRPRRHRPLALPLALASHGDRKSTRLNSSHANILYAVFFLKKTSF